MPRLRIVSEAFEVLERAFNASANHPKLCTKLAAPYQSGWLRQRSREEEAVRQAPQGREKLQRCY